MGRLERGWGLSASKPTIALLLAEQGFLLLYQRPIEFGPEAG
jgi:hypothetical protein